MAETDEAFTHDVRRSVLLGAFIRAWGMPANRVVARHGESGHLVEVYEFPAEGDQAVARFVTVGMSSQVDCELLLVLPNDLAGAPLDDVFHFMLDVAAYVVSDRPEEVLPFAVPPTDLAPAAWGTRALLVDQARAEAEELNAISVGEQVVALAWVVLVHTAEYELIARRGVEAFDALVERKKANVIDVHRDALT